MEIRCNAVYYSHILFIQKVCLTCSNMIVFTKCSSNSEDISDVYELEDCNIQNVCDTYYNYPMFLNAACIRTFRRFSKS
jgi:hypothetical protein